MSRSCRVPGRTAEVGVRGGEPAGGLARRLLPASCPAGPEALVVVTSTDAARERPQGVAARAALRLRGRVGRAAAHPQPELSLAPARWSLGISGPPAPLISYWLGGSTETTALSRAPGPWRRLLPANAVRTRGAAGAVARGAGAGVGLVLPPPNPPTACRAARRQVPPPFTPARDPPSGPRQAFPSRLPRPPPAPLLVPL